MADYETERLIGKKVIHIKFGEGTATKTDGAQITIAFSGIGERKFQYPDAFEKFLSVEDEGLKKSILVDLELRKSEDTYIKNKKSQELYARTRAFEKQKAAEHERRVQKQAEKQRQAYERSQMLQYNRNRKREENRGTNGSDRSSE